MKSKSKGKARAAVGVGAYSEQDWRAEADLDTLIRAEEIKRDKKRHERAQACARKRLEAVATVTVAKA